MSRPRLIKDIPKYRQEFKKLFYGSVFINPLGDYIYSIKTQPNNDTNYDYDSYLLYPLNGHGVKRLMQKSLEVGKDLILEECKNRPYDEIKEMCKFYNVSTEEELYKLLKLE